MEGTTTLSGGELKKSWENELKRVNHHRLMWWYQCGGRIPLIGERAQATLRGRPRGRLGRVGSGKGCLRGRPRGRFGTVGSATVALRGRPRRFGSTQAAGATLKRSNSETL